MDVLLASVGPELPWLCGYEAMPLERLTMLVVTREASPVLVVPRLEAPRVRVEGGEVTVRPWAEAEDPVALVADLVGSARTVAVGDRTWARFVLDLQQACAGVRFGRAGPIVGPLRARKDPHEIDALAAAAAAADRVAAQLQRGDVALRGRTEAEVSAELGRRLVAEGHERVNFAIVAAGPNAASPHHDAGARRIAEGDVVLCDFGGTLRDEWGVGYCSDITRCVAVGEPSSDVVDAYTALRDAQEAGVRAATVGVAAQSVDAACRAVLDAAGYGDRFIHRTGHGIGVEEHEDPYLVDGNIEVLQAGHVFSVEPGVYTPGAWGLRLEDIVAAGEDGPRRLNHAERDLVVVDA